MGLKRYLIIAALATLIHVVLGLQNKEVCKPLTYEPPPANSSAELLEFDFMDVLVANLGNLTAVCEEFDKTKRPESDDKLLDDLMETFSKTVKDMAKEKEIKRKAIAKLGNLTEVIFTYLIDTCALNVLATGCEQNALYFKIVSSIKSRMHDVCTATDEEGSRWIVERHEKFMNDLSKSVYGELKKTALVTQLSPEELDYLLKPVMDPFRTHESPGRDAVKEFLNLMVKTVTSSRESCAYSSIFVQVFVVADELLRQLYKDIVDKMQKDTATNKAVHKISDDVSKFTKTIEDIDKTLKSDLQKSIHNFEVVISKLKFTLNEL